MEETTVNSAETWNQTSDSFVGKELIASTTAEVQSACCQIVVLFSEQAYIFPDSKEIRDTWLPILLNAYLLFSKALPQAWV